MDYSKNFKKVIEHAKMRSTNGLIEPNHLLAGIILTEESIGYKMLTQLIDIDDAKSKVESLYNIGETTEGSNDKAQLSALTEQIMLQSSLEAKRSDSELVRTEHLVLTYVKSKLIDGVSYEHAKNVLNEIYDSNSQKSNNMSKTVTKPKSTTPLLDEFTTDYTDLAVQGKLDPIVGRESELKRISQVLSRRKKNNPVLIGLPGVGKTAIVEGLAINIINRDVPETLYNKRLLALEMGNIVAGTKYRGEFEERMKKIVDELKSSDNIILYIDEIHTLVGAGSTSGTLDAANILKPALSRGEISCIGSTTLDEYRKIEKDGALERRFQKVMVDEPTYDETRSILYRLKSKYEEYHNVVYTDDAIESCLKLSDRYITDRAFPDKAIDALDESGASVRVNDVIPQEVITLEKHLKEVIESKNNKVRLTDYEGAAEDKKLQTQIEFDIEDFYRNKKESSVKRQVTSEDVALVVSIMTGIPSKNISEDDTTKLIALEGELKRVVLGQDEAVAKIVRAVLRNKAGLSDTKRPIGTFMFMGPTGVGKCHGKGTPILMYDGSIKNVEDVVVGDLLMGDDSTPRTVLSLARGKDNMYKITPLKGDSFTCNEPHILSLKRTGTYNVVNIPLNEYLTKSKTFKHEHKLWKTGVSFDTKSVKIDPYFMGLWLGDGKSNRVGITTEDKEIVDYIYKVASDYGLKVNINYHEDNNSNTYLLTDTIKGEFYNNPLLKEFRYYGLMDRSNNNKKFIPNDYLINDELNRKKLLAGLIDSDGYTFHNTVEISTKYFELGEQIKYLGRSLGYSVNMRPKLIKGVEYYILSISGDMSDLPLLLNRKKSTPRLQKKNVLLTQFSVEELGMDDYYGFEIDGNHLYLLGDFTVTHNTYLAKKLAEQLFTSDKDMIRIDMSEYMEKHTVSRLIGAPPGYIGHDEAGQLTEAVRRKPYSIILLDEIEKAHPDVCNILLQIFEDGILTDSQGKTVNFKNTVIIMTSNVGSREAKNRGNGIGFTDNKKQLNKSVVENALKSKFAPEFLNRIDEIINFESLGREEIKGIIDLELSKFVTRLNENGLDIDLDESAKQFLFEKGWDEDLGARPLKRAIQKYIEDEVSIKLITGVIKRGNKIYVTRTEGSDELNFKSTFNLLGGQSTEVVDIVK